MKLFVFEGRRREVCLFETIEQLFFENQKDDRFICTYNSSIYSLYSRLKEYDVFDKIDGSGDTVSILNEILTQNGDTTLENINPADISEIFLFFDYDFQNSQLSLEINNQSIQNMLDYFNEETENGKLYINYPMIESIRYTKELPDNNYYAYTVTREECHNFKQLANIFSYYKSNDHLVITNNENESEDKKQVKKSIIYNNWLLLIEMNVAKANYICFGVNKIMSNSTILQQNIFTNQLTKYVCTAECKIAILNAFPLFLYEYFKDLVRNK